MDRLPKPPSNPVQREVPSHFTDVETEAQGRQHLAQVAHECRTVIKCKHRPLWLQSQGMPHLRATHPLRVQCPGQLSLARRACLGREGPVLPQNCPSASAHLPKEDGGGRVHLYPNPCTPSVPGPISLQPGGAGTARIGRKPCWGT